jgi:hypothetical protein
MTSENSSNENGMTHSARQQLFLRYSFAVLVDLTVLNLFNEYWDYVYIELFSISLLTAILLQVLLVITIKIEHRVIEYFKKKSGIGAKITGGLAVWGILFGSKLVILEAINYTFGDSVEFGGPWHGVVSFIVVVVAVIVAEQAFIKTYRSLA